jgi:predicted phage terminase large subunit-like protein
MQITELNEKQLLVTLEAELGKRSLYEFFKMATGILYPSVKWDYNWHFQYIAGLLQAEVQRIIDGQPKDRDFIINLPFRSGKSILISIIFPVWIHIKQASLSIISVSATDALATKFTHQSKILIESEWFQQRWGNLFQIRFDQHAKGNYMNNSGGRRESFGINSGIIGSGSDIMLLDDIQSPDNVSAIGLKNTIESFTDVLYSRLNNPDVSIRICLQQRVHENDISGYLMRTNPLKYYHICIPAILSQDLHPSDLAIHYIDKLFWQSRFSQKVMEDFRTTMRPAPYAGQLLQRPVPEEGDMIRRSWFTYMKLSEVLPLNLQWQLVLDSAFTKKTTNDPSGWLIVAKHGNNLIIRHAGRGWLEFNDLIEKIKELRQQFGWQKVWVEMKASGPSITQELKRLTNYSVMELHPKSKDKIERVKSAQPSLSAKRVILVQDDSGWQEMLLSECASFPFSVHDDLVDCLSYSVMQFLNQAGTTVFKSF